MYTILVKLTVNPYINKVKAYKSTDDIDYLLDDLVNFTIINDNSEIVDVATEDILSSLDYGAIGLLTNDTTKNILDILANDDIRPYDEYYVICNVQYCDNWSYEDISIEFNISNKIRTKRKIYDNNKWKDIYKLLTEDSN